MSVAQVIEKRLQGIEAQLSCRPGLAEMFRRCFLNTAETTVTAESDGRTFVITGDIPAMWLRDSSEQVFHYIRFAGEEPAVARMIEGLILKQVDCILADPYANAFNACANGKHCNEDYPKPSPLVWERKYEVDSLCHMVRLSSLFYQATRTSGWMNERFFEALKTIVSIFRLEQRHDAQSAYRFIRKGVWSHDTLGADGQGSPTAYTGMTWSGFRPSDDRCELGYLVPANLFAASILTDVAAFAELGSRQALKEEALALQDDIRRGIAAHGLMRSEAFGEIYAYEVDGLGKQIFMDDANVPSLLALPFLGVCSADDPLYLRTRAACLSAENPYYYEGSCAKGIGSPHTPDRYIWPIALCVQAMTSTDIEEITGIVRTLLNTTADTHLMHESFDKDDPSRFTRPWFAWANSLFGELMYRLYEQGMLETLLSRL